jgi:hypothetical protein
MKRSCLALLGALVAVGSVGSAKADSTIDIKLNNKSKWAIHHLYLSGTKEDEWGPDQLGEKDGDTIEPNSSFTLKGVPVGKYALRLVDEDGDECVVDNIKIAASEVVDITDQNLLGCQGATEKAAAEEDEGE